MNRLAASAIVACVAVLSPCVAIGAGSEGSRDPATPAASPFAVIGSEDGNAVSARAGMPGGGARAAVKSRPGLDLRSVQAPKDLAEAIRDSPAPMTAPSAEYWVSLAGSTFTPATSASTWPAVYNSWGCVNTSNGATLTAPVAIPQGAVVSNMWLNIWRNGSFTSTAFLMRYGFQGISGSQLASVSPPASTSGFRSDWTNLSAVIDTNMNSYAVIWVNTGDSFNQLCSIQVGYYMPPTGTYNPVAPCRQVDTRGGSPLTPANRNFQITGSPCGIPTGATGVTANITVVNTTASGYLAVWPQGTAWPGNSTLNYTAGQIVANSANLTLSGGGQVTANCFTGATDLIIDITGYFY